MEEESKGVVGRLDVSTGDDRTVSRAHLFVKYGSDGRIYLRNISEKQGVWVV